jgi:hypothetical protein
MPAQRQETPSPASRVSFLRRTPFNEGSAWQSFAKSSHQSNQEKGNGEAIVIKNAHPFEQIFSGWFMKNESEIAGAGRSAARLLAYYLLVIFFGYLSSELLVELNANYPLDEFMKIKELLALTMNSKSQADDIVVTLWSLLSTFIFVLPIGWIYMLTKRDEGIDPSLVQTIIVLAMVVCGVMMLVQDNLARAFGLVGVVAAVRFRNTLKDTKDAVYVFLAIGIGMGCGLRAYHIAVWLSIVMSSVMYVLWKFRVGRAAAGLEVSALTNASEPEKKKEKKKNREKEPTAKLSGASLKRIEENLEQTERLRRFARVLAGKNKGIKKPNAALIIRATSAAEAQHRLDRVLANGGQAWHLASASFTEQEGGKLEYLGRMELAASPAALIESLRQSGKPFVRDVELIFLRGLKKHKNAVEAEGSERLAEGE